MKLTLTQFVTLDGVSQGPGSPTEDTSDGFDRGGWLVPYLGKEFIQRTSAWLDVADGLAARAPNLRVVRARLACHHGPPSRSG